MKRAAQRGPVFPNKGFMIFLLGNEIWTAPAGASCGVRGNNPRADDSTLRDGRGY
jgi:hypothetical protein